MTKLDFAHLPLKNLAQELKTDLSQGLSPAEARRQLAQYGPNTLPTAPGSTIWQLYFEQLRSPLIYLLIVVACITAALGERSDATVIVIVITLNSFIGFFQEWRALKRMAALQSYLAPTAKVIRDGQVRKILAAELTIGDLVHIEAGDRVPADLRLTEAYQLQANEASFTGESEPADKTTEPHTSSENTVPNTLALMGSTIVNGSGQGLVIRVGTQTELGRISNLLNQAEETTSPLAHTITQLSQNLLKLISGAVALVIVIGVIYQHSWYEMMHIGISLAVSAIPEGLPVVVTITLSIGLWKMAKHRSIVRRLDAVETLGGVQVICTDKTGTLTRGEMMVDTITLLDRQLSVTGQGFRPEGAFLEGKKQLSPADDSDLQELTLMSLLSTDARTEKNDHGEYQAIGDPTETALYVLGQKGVGLKNTAAAKYKHLFNLPFDQAKRYSLKVYQTSNHKFVTIIKGSPESIEKLKHSSAKTASWLSKNASAQAQESKRMIAISWQVSSENPIAGLKKNHLPTFKHTALLALSDPLRSDTFAALAACAKSGIRVLMITGDHALTAQAIGKQLGFKNTEPLTGDEISAMSDTELKQALAHTDIIARATPEVKIQLIKVLQKQHQVIAMTGDGVNDGPALKQADVGIAMGRSGSDVAIQASDMILTDDNFANIVAAIKEGRIIWFNLRKVLFYLLSTSVGEILVIMSSFFLQLPLPLLAPQILWLNLVTDGFLDVTLATEKGESDVLTHPPRPKNSPLLDQILMKRLLFTGLWMTVTGMIFFAATLPLGLAKAQTLVLLNLAVIQWFNAWNARSETKTLFERNPFSNKALLVGLSICIVLQILAVSWPPLQTLLKTTHVTLTEWAIVIAAASTIILADVIWKKVLLPVLMWRLKN